MRILANLCSVVPGGVGGAEQYSTGLLKAVLDHVSTETTSSPESELQLEIASLAGVREAHAYLKPHRWHEAPLPPKFRSLRLFAESTWLAKKSKGFDLVHHFGGRAPAIRRRVAVVTIHDLQPFDMPENFSPLKRKYLTSAITRTVNSDAFIATPSQWVADQICTRFNVDPSRLWVVPPSIELLSPTDQQEHFYALGLNTDDPFIFYPAATYPHKNHKVLIDAFAQVRKDHPDLKLVLTGGAGRSHNEVMAQVTATPGVIHLGYVTRPQLEHLYRSATALAMPSTYEGFGLPVAEALAAGTPVIISNAGALPEVAATTTPLDPHTPKLWTAAITELLNTPTETHEEPSQPIFSPTNTATQLLKLWTTCLKH